MTAAMATAPGTCISHFVYVLFKQKLKWFRYKSQLKTTVLA